MTIYSTPQFLPALGAARAEATGRTWFLVQDPTTSRSRLTDDPGSDHHLVIAAIFRPPHS